RRRDRREVRGAAGAPPAGGGRPPFPHDDAQDRHGPRADRRPGGDIAQRALELGREPQLKPYADLPRMAERAQQMVKESLDAFVTRDTELARRLCGEDADVDAPKEQSVRELLTFMLEDPKTIP